MALSIMVSNARIGLVCSRTLLLPLVVAFSPLHRSYAQKQAFSSVQKHALDFTSRGLLAVESLSSS